MRPVGLIVGGTNVRREYEASVEIVAGVEQSSLNGRRLADLPVKVGTKVASIVLRASVLNYFFS